MTRRWWIAFAVAAVTFGVLDAIWLTLAASSLYKSLIGHLMAAQPDMIAAVVFYVIFLIGLLHFVVQPDGDRTKGARLRDAALFGFVTYATFDLTSKAVLKDFGWTITLIDITWGIVVTTVTTFVVDLVLRRLRPQPKD